MPRDTRSPGHPSLRELGFDDIDCDWKLKPATCRCRAACHPTSCVHLRLVALGVDPGSVMDHLGHTDTGFTLRVYRHGMPRDGAGRDRRGRSLKDELTETRWSAIYDGFDLPGSGTECRSITTDYESGWPGVGKLSHCSSRSALSRSVKPPVNAVVFGLRSATKPRFCWTARISSPVRSQIARW